MTTFIEIDGSQGEGGGQIIRTSLALSAVTGKPFRIKNIRANRKKPGLKNQHVVAATAASRICNAATDGISLGSSQLTFEPNPISGGHYEFEVGTAGSTSLVAQAVLPALIMADRPSTVVIRGGTHNPMSPTFEFLKTSYLPQLSRFGVSVTAEIHRRGFFPAGGGCVQFNIEPATSWQEFHLLERGQPTRTEVTALVSNLPTHIGRREIDTICRKAGWSSNQGRVITDEDSPGPGNVVWIELGYQQVTAIFTGFGKLGVTAEQVAGSTYRRAKLYLNSDVPVEEHLADQLMLPMGLAASQGHSTSFRTFPLSSHSRTHLEILKRFLDISIHVPDSDADDVIVRIEP